MSKEIHEIDPSRVKVFIHRERNPARWEMIKQDVRNRGQMKPGKVRDISDQPKEDRKRPEGGYYDYALIVGEGRLQIAQALGRKFRCTIEDEKKARVIGQFLAENLNREPLPWFERAKLIHPEIQAGKSIEEIAAGLSMSPKHVLKLKRIFDKTAPEIADEVARMPLNDAEVLTALPSDQQTIVLEVARDTGQLREIQAIVRKAKVVEQRSGKISPSNLRKEIDAVDAKLKRSREMLQLKRRDYSLGPANLITLLEDPKFRRLIQREGVNIQKFEKATE